jgi:hypothetical protein
MGIGWGGDGAGGGGTMLGDNGAVGGKGTFSFFRSGGQLPPPQQTCASWRQRCVGA